MRSRFIPSVCLFLLSELSACGPRESAIVVDVRGWERIVDDGLNVKLSVSVGLSNKFEVYPELVRRKVFSIALPSNSSGPVALSLIVLDKDGCMIAGGNADGPSLGPAPEVQHVELPIGYYAFRGCDRTLAKTQNLHGVWGFSSSDVWAVGDRATIIHWAGKDWSISPVPTNTGDLYSIWGLNSTNMMWAAGEAADNPGIILGFSSSSWTSYFSAKTPLRSIYGNASSLSAVGLSSYIVSGGFTPGSCCLPRGPGSSKEFDGVWADGSSAWAVGDSGTIAYQVSTAGAWRDEPIGVTNAKLRGIWSAGNGNLWIVGDDNTFIACNTSGTSFLGCNKRNNGFFNMNNHYFAIWGRNESDIWAVGNFGAIQHWDGNQWSPVTSGTAKDLHSVWGTEDGQEIWIVGDGVILNYSKR